VLLYTEQCLDCICAVLLAQGKLPIHITRIHIHGVIIIGGGDHILVFILAVAPFVIVIPTDAVIAVVATVAAVIVVEVAKAKIAM